MHFQSRRLGPATVGGIKLGCIRFQKVSGGVLNNIVMSRLYRAGSVAYVSTSGGMSQRIEQHDQQEFQWSLQMCCHWWKKKTWKSFFFCGDHMFRFHDALGAKILLFFGEVRGLDGTRGKWQNYQTPRWCVGTCACCFVAEVQFVMRAPKLEMIWKPLHPKIRT